VLSVRSISSSYLPEWRPGTDYRNTYSAHKELGGGVSIDLIHEWDYLAYLFGFPQAVSCTIGKKSDLEIDTDDFAIYIAEYKDKIAEVHLDYFGRAAIRTIELITKEDTIIGDLIGQTVTYLKSGKRIQFNEERDDYQKRELRYFLQTMEERKAGNNEISHAIRVLKLTQGGI
jgi:predicted dehydrogenase